MYRDGVIHYMVRKMKGLPNPPPLVTPHDSVIPKVCNMSYHVYRRSLPGFFSTFSNLIAKKITMKREHVNRRWVF